MAVIFATVKNKELAIKIGTLIAHLRRNAGFSQESFAYEADIARTHMALIESGGCAVQVETLVKICFSLNLPIKDFFGMLEEFEAAAAPKKPRKPKVTRRS